MQRPFFCLNVFLRVAWLRPFARHGRLRFGSNDLLKIRASSAYGGERGAHLEHCVGPKLGI